MVQIVHQLLILQVVFLGVRAHTCTVGKERGANNTWIWVLSHQDPCNCTNITVGGINLESQVSRISPAYYANRLLVSDDVREIRQHYGIDCNDGDGFTNASIRLVDGSSSHDGRVEVLHNGVWGEVCDNLWDNNNAKVVCRQLGLPYGSAQALSYVGYYGYWYYFYQGFGQIWLDDVSCTGNESSLDQCEHAGWGQHNCYYNNKLAGVLCVNVCSVALGIAEGGIKDNQLSSSSSIDNYPVTEARLNGSKAWRSEESSPWIQVDFGTLTRVTAVATQGRADGIQDQWVTTYYMEYISRELQWINIQAGSFYYAGSLYLNYWGNFRGNTDSDSIAINYFRQPVDTTRIRLYPLVCENQCALRVELFGCI